MRKEYMKMFRRTGMLVLMAVLLLVGGRTAFAGELTGKPSAPSAANASGGIMLDWDEVADADDYLVYRKASGESGYTQIADAGDETSFLDTDTVCGTTYAYKIQAANDESETALSASVSLRRLTPPETVKAANTSVKTGMKISWSKVTGATGYYIYRKVSGGSYSLLKTVSGDTYLYDTTVKNHKTYAYKIKAYYKNSSGMKSVSVSGSSASYKYLKTPSFASSDKETDTTIKVSWSDDDYMTGYQVQYATDKKFSDAQLKTVSGSSATVKNLSAATKYYLRLRCYYKSDSGSKYYSAWSSTKTCTTKNMAEDSITVGGTKITLGMKASALGDPDESFDSTYNMTWQVYGTDTYEDFYAVGVSGGKVYFIIAAGSGFNYMGMKAGSQAGDVTGDDCEVYIATDSNDSDKVHAVELISYDYNSNKTYSADALAGESKMIFHLTNAFRVWHDLSALTWDSKAAKAARLHSKDMADNDYFSHTGLDGSDPGDRMSDQGISWSGYGENITAGTAWYYGSGFNSYDSWVNSSGHRDNMLSNWKYLGCGCAYNADSTYEYYATQNFWR